MATTTTTTTTTTLAPKLARFKAIRDTIQEEEKRQGALDHRFEYHDPDDGLPARNRGG